MEEVTLKTIANRLGVSISTVSRALKDHPDIKASTKKAVFALAEELEYEPNQLAFQLLNRRSKTIGVVVPKISYPLYSQAITGIEEVAEQNGYQLLICQTHESYGKEVRQVQSLLSSRVSGIILSLSARSARFDHLLKVQSRNVPLVLFNRDCEEITCSKVIIDNFKAAYEATSVLLGRGRERIAYIGGPTHLQISQKRLEGYCRALQDAGRERLEAWTRVVSFEKESMKEQIRQLLYAPTPRMPCSPSVIRLPSGRWWWPSSWESRCRGN